MHSSANRLFFLLLFIHPQSYYTFPRGVLMYRIPIPVFRETVFVY